MARVAVLQHLQIERKVGAITHGPKQGVGIVGVNVIVYCDDHFAARTQQGGGAIQGPPNLGLRHFSIDHNGDHLAQVGQRFVHDHFFHTLDAHGLAQMIQEDGF